MDQFVGEDVVLEKLGDERQEGRISRRRAGDKTAVCRKVDAMLATGVTLCQSFQEEAQHLSIASRHQNLVIGAGLSFAKLDIFEKLLPGGVVMENGSFPDEVQACGGVVAQDGGSIGCVKVNMFACQRQDGMHEALVFDRDGHHHVLESILVFTLDSKHGAEVFIVVLPEDHVFDRLEPVEDGLHRNGQDAV